MFLVLLAATFLASLASALVVGRLLGNRRWVVRVVFAVVGGLAAACTIWALVIGAFLVALFEPWPFARHQGPDTSFSRSCYAEFLGEAPPVDVTRIYCRREWGFGGDSIYSISFAFRADSTAEAIVERLQLDVVTAPVQGRVRYLSGPWWWPPEARLARIRQVYQRNGRAFFWVDTDSKEAYFQQANF